MIHGYCQGLDLDTRLISRPHEYRILLYLWERNYLQVRVWRREDLNGVSEFSVGLMQPDRAEMQRMQSNRKKEHVQSQEVEP